MRVVTAGESHGKALVAIIEGLPKGLEIDLNAVNAELKRRASGYGRSARQNIECDEAELISGVKGLRTLGSPLTLVIYNKDQSFSEDLPPVTAVRPGHADLAGLQKFGGQDAREILERASARETAIRVAAGAVLRQYLSAFGVEITGYVKSVGGVFDEQEYTFEEIKNGRSDALSMIDGALEERAKAEIDACAAAGDTCGGILELRVKGLKSGFGSCMTYAEKLDARIAGALMSVQAIKGVEVGRGFALASIRGSETHDEIFCKDGQFFRKTNRAGGIEGGMSNGNELVFRAAMKPIPTLGRGLQSADYVSGEPVRAAKVRSDVCAVKACEAVLEAALSIELAAALSERLGGDSLQEVQERYGRLKP